MGGILKGNSYKNKDLLKLIHGILESLAWHKLGGVGGADLDFCSSLRVAACAGLTLDHLEVPESHQVDRIPFFQRVDDRLKNAIHRGLRFGLAADDVCHFVDQIRLVHEFPLSSR